MSSSKLPETSLTMNTRDHHDSEPHHIDLPKVSALEELLGPDALYIDYENYLSKHMKRGAEFNSEDIRERHEFIDYGIGAHNITPRTKDLMMRWREALLLVEDNASKKNVRDAIFVEYTVRDRFDLRTIVSSEDRQLCNNISKLMEGRLLARYGDLPGNAAECDSLPTDAPDQAIDAAYSSMNEHACAGISASRHSHPDLVVGLSDSWPVAGHDHLHANAADQYPAGETDV